VFEAAIPALLGAVTGSVIDRPSDPANVVESKLTRARSRVRCGGES